MDEKLLEEIRRQEARAEDSEEVEMETGEDDAADDDEEPVAEAKTPKASGQQTLMGYGSDE